MVAGWGKAASTVRGDAVRGGAASGRAECDSAARLGSAAAQLTRGRGGPGVFIYGGARRRPREESRPDSGAARHHGELGLPGDVGGGGWAGLGRGLGRPRSKEVFLTKRKEIKQKYNIGILYIKKFRKSFPTT